jgi:hypothetical protein
LKGADHGGRGVLARVAWGPGRGLQPRLALAIGIKFRLAFAVIARAAVRLSQRLFVRGCCCGLHSQPRIACGANNATGLEAAEHDGR